MSNALTQTPKTLTGILADESIKKRFNEILGAKSAGFMSSILSLYNAKEELRKCDPNSIVSAAAIAATLDLPINPSLGFAHIVPYGGVAQFQMGWKGFVQLGLNTGEYEIMNASEVYEDELKSWNPITGEIEFHPQDTWKQRASGNGKIVGYFSYFKLLSGYRHSFYMTVDEVRAHGKKYSKAFNVSGGQWQTNFSSMAKKTVMKLNLAKFGPLSIDKKMQKAIQMDQAVVAPDWETPEFPDRPEDVATPAKPSGSDRKINEDELKLLMARADHFGFQEEDIKAYIKKEFGKESRKDLTVEELTKVLKWMEQLPPGL